MFGIENYCYVKYVGDPNNEIKYYWYVNTLVGLKNGLGYDETIWSEDRLDSIEGIDEYFEVEFKGKKYYYEKLNINFYFFNKKSLSKYFRPVDDLIKEDADFLFLIDSGDYSKLKDYRISEKIIEQVRKGKCKIVLNTSYEPYSIEKVDYMFELNKFVEKFKLNRNSLKIITGNLIVQNFSTNYDFIPYPYFLENPWFINKDALLLEKNHINQVRDLEMTYKKNREKFIEINRNIKSFSKKILCYNRRAHPHRRYLFYHLYNDQFLNQNMYISLNNQDQRANLGYDLSFGCNIEESEIINKFYQNNTNNYTFDGEDLDINLATDFNLDFHKKTFVSVVSETSVSKDVIFYSEKTFKPIYACQPFILSSSAGSLKKLKEYGFQTFDKWWDESYDDEILFSERVKKMKEVLNQICLKSDEELATMLNEMESVLLHNYDTFINSTNSYLLDIIHKICPYKFKKII